MIPFNSTVIPEANEQTSWRRAVSQLAVLPSQHTAAALDKHTPPLLRKLSEVAAYLGVDCLRREERDVDLGRLHS